MLEKEFVPYDIALSLRDLGFDEPCLGRYGTTSKKLFLNKIFRNSDELMEDGNFSNDLFAAPLYSQVIRWFKDKHRIITELTFYNNGEEWEETEFKITLNRFEDFATHNTFVKSGIKSYEEAELIAVKELIKIIKEKKIKEGDIVRYPIGWTLAVRKVYKDENDNLYVKECINTKDEYKRFIYKSNYDSWDSSLHKELGFNLANENEIQYLED